MSNLQHIISEDDLVNLEAVKYMSPAIEAVEHMTRGDLFTHLAIRTRMGASLDEIWEKCERWADARDVHELFKKVRASHA